MRNYLRFLHLWLQNPTRIGAVAPSSKNLGAAMAAEIDLAKPGVVVELGGGTGSITAALLAYGIPPRDLIVIEREETLCAIIAQRFPEVRVIQGDARKLDELLKHAAVGPVKAVISGLPLLSLSKQVEFEILQQCFKILPAEGYVVQFTYLPRPPVGRAIAARLDLLASRTAWVLENLPPASVWVYRRQSAETALRKIA